METAEVASSNHVNVLAFIDQKARQKLIQSLLSDTGGTAFSVDIVDSYDDAISRTGNLGSDVFIVDKHFQDDRGLEIVWELASQNTRVPAIVVNEHDSRDDLSEAVNLGAASFAVWDQLDSRYLERLIHLSIDRKKYEGSLRQDQDELIRQVMDLQDSRERFEAQSAEHVKLAEDLAIAQDKLQKTLAEVSESREQLEQLNQEKDKFFSIIAHDLKSPFTSLLGLTQIMANGAGMMDAEALANSAEMVNSSAKNVYRLLENLLEWARLQMDQVPFEPKKVALSELVAESMAPLEAVAAEKEISVSAAVGDLEAICDRAMIDTVIRNFINNAIKFTDHGGSVKISAETEDERVRLRVDDSGVGMDVAQIENLFNIGSGNSTKGTKGEKGTGLGLLLCKDFIDMHEGKIDVQSKIGKGSTFSFTLALS
ncbi:MAG: hybrid sensor histidine kinase/response regulator [Rhodospirillaceae bacterium]|nr:hybrid sensor histidine kinase/response regulator [Rhodospirillaceae bacterium]MBT4588445.1 hybrid sensor histidine kinase/response regulator [Rhodospirillaceae bacterium]